MDDIEKCDSLTNFEPMAISRVAFATDNCNIKLIRLTCQPWSRQPGSPRSLRRRRQHPLHCWPAGTWCWRTPPPAPHTACRGRKQQPNIFKCVGILFDAFLYIYHSHLPLNWEILKVFSEPFSSPLISSTGAKPCDEIVIRNISEKNYNCGQLWEARGQMIDMWPQWPHSHALTTAMSTERQASSKSERFGNNLMYSLQRMIFLFQWTR